MSWSTGPVETKAATGTIGSVVGTALATVIVWALNRYALPEPMPAEIAAAMSVLIVAGVTFFGAWLGPHTNRQDADALAASRGRHARPSPEPRPR